MMRKDKVRKGKPRKIHMPPQVDQWLRRAFVVDHDGLIPKTVLYELYEDFCNSIKIRPRPPNTFGKLLVLVHPHIRTRRMGPHSRQVAYYAGISPQVHESEGEREKASEREKKKEGKKKIKREETEEDEGEEDDEGDEDYQEEEEHEEEYEEMEEGTSSSSSEGSLPSSPFQALQTSPPTSPRSSSSSSSSPASSTPCSPNTATTTNNNSSTTSTTTTTTTTTIHASVVPRPVAYAPPPPPLSSSYPYFPQPQQPQQQTQHPQQPQLLTTHSLPCGCVHCCYPKQHPQHPQQPHFHPYPPAPLILAPAPQPAFYAESMATQYPMAYGIPPMEVPWMDEPKVEAAGFFNFAMVKDEPTPRPLPPYHNTKHNSHNTHNSHNNNEATWVSTFARERYFFDSFPGSAAIKQEPVYPPTTTQPLPQQQQHQTYIQHIQQQQPQQPQQPLPLELMWKSSTTNSMKDDEEWQTWLVDVETAQFCPPPPTTKNPDDFFACITNCRP